MSDIPEEYSAINLRMKIAEIEPEKAAALWGTPGVIVAMNAYFNEAILAEREACAKIAEEYTKPWRLNALYIRNIQDESLAKPCSLAASIRRR